MKNVNAVLLWFSFVAFQLIVITKVLDKTPHEFQWLAALVVPISKEINDRIISRLITKAALPENIIEAVFAGKITNNISYSFWLAISLATSVTEITGYVLLGINFCINLPLCFKALKLGKRVSTDGSENMTSDSLRGRALTEMILNESVEIIQLLS